MENTLKSISQNVLAKLEHLKCPICLDIVENVRELPCRHIFCSNCLETYKKDKDTFSCPLCKKEIPKRKLLSHDAALDTLCSFVRALCDDVKVHHKSDIKTFFSNVYNENESNNGLKIKSESDEIIPQSSDENVIPCTSKPIDKKRSIKKKTLNASKLVNKTGPKAIKLEIKKNLSREEKKKMLPKLGLSRKQKGNENVDNLVPNLKQKLIPQLQQNSHKHYSDKNKILRWLHDTRNRFERFSQTQSYATQNYTPMDIDMQSVSQIHVEKLKKDKKPPQFISNNDQKIRILRAHSVENLASLECKKLRRHSLECTSPIKMRQYQNLQDINSIENKLIINLIEDEVLDVIDKEISDENNRWKTPPSSKKKYSDCKNTGVTKENEFLAQLDNEMLGNSFESKRKESSRKIDLNITEVEQGNKSKSSWKNMKKFGKTTGKTKVPKKLDISLQSTQRSNKKDIETKLNTSDREANILILQNKTVDFQKMEDYFSRAIPQMMEKNVEEAPLLERTSDEDIYPKDETSNENSNHKESKLIEEQEKDNNSDIYIYQTQPLSKEMIDPKIDKISYAAKLTKKLDNILQELTKGDQVKTDELTSLFPSIENIFKIFEQFENNKYSQQKFQRSTKKPSFSEKQIQTDMLSLDGFPITPTAAFKSLIQEDVGTQTDNFCPECPHECQRKTYENITNATAALLMGSEITGKSEQNNMSKKGTDSSIEFEQNYAASKSQKKNTDSQTKSSLVKEMKVGKAPSSRVQMQSFIDEKVEILKTPSLKKQISSNYAERKNANTSVLLESQISVEHILEQCNTQFNSGTSPNISKIDENNSTSKVKDNKNKSIVNTSQGSAIMCSLPRSNSRVNRKLMFEKTLKERNELLQTMKRVRSENTSDSEEERPYKVKCNRFLQNDLSIEFESESLNDNSQYMRDSDVLMVKHNENSSSIKNKSMSCENNKNKNPEKRSQNIGKHTQADKLLNYCDDLIEKSNRQIAHRNILSEENNDINLSQILSESNKNFKTNEKLNHSINKKPSQAKIEVNEKIKTQDLLKHYDELINNASKQIEIENLSPSKHNKTVQYTCSEIPTTSKHVFYEDNEVQEKRDVMKTQDLLDHCNELIAKTTKEIARNEIESMDNEAKDIKVQSENDDDFFCQNLDQLDSVLEKENNRAGLSREKLSESLFETCKENLIHGTSVLEKKTVGDIENIFNTPKRKKTNNNNEKKKKFKVDTNEANGFNSSDDEIFSDVDVVETTPQKALSFVERLSCSQVVNQNSRMSLRIPENTEKFPESLDIVPPPPGFDDEEDKVEETISEKTMGNNERESENVIPNSLSPQRFGIPAPRKPLKTHNFNSKNFAVPQEVATLSQQFMKVSPICPDKSRNMNVIEMVRQSKFSPLTIVPKSNPPVLTSTPKQKSILSYAKPKMKTSQETPSTSTLEKSKPCIAYTRLNNAETLSVLSLCNKNLATRQDKFGPDVTHMIVSVDKHNNVKDHTIKFISAIAAGIWVLNIKWVQECVAKNDIVDEEPFEVLDITGIPSPRISRLNRLTNPLLKGFKFFIPRSFTQTTAEDVKNIIQLLKGDVVSSIEELTYTDREKYTCIVISELVDTEDYTQYENWLMSHKLITVDINWLSLSVSRYKILSLRPHLICSDDSIEELGYPSNLVLDVAPSLTQDVTVFD